MTGYISWSGRDAPKHGAWNDAGQRLEITEFNDIELQYNATEDKRPRTPERSESLSILESHGYNVSDTIVLATWTAEQMAAKVNRKFNQNGIAKLVTSESSGAPTGIDFIDPFDYNTFLGWIREGHVFFDPGMTSKNPRPYCHFRVRNSFLARLAQRWR